MHWQPLTTAAALLTLGGAGALVGGPLTVAALRQVRIERVVRKTERVLCRAAVAGGGVFAVFAAHRTGTTLYLPALAIWGMALAALAACDALTLRIATPMCRQAILTVVAFVTFASVATHDWRGLSLAFSSALCASLILAGCARFLGVGKGDGRLAALGGLGLGHVAWPGLLAAVIALITVVAIQAAMSRRRDLRPTTTTFGDERRREMPLGAALATGFLVAASV